MFGLELNCLNEIITIAVGAVFSVAGGLAIRALTKIDRNQEKLFTKYEDHEKRLTKIETQHELLAPKHLEIMEG